MSGCALFYPSKFIAPNVEIKLALGRAVLPDLRCSPIDEEFKEREVLRLHAGALIAHNSNTEREREGEGEEKRDSQTDRDIYWRPESFSLKHLAQCTLYGSCTKIL